MDIKLNSNFNSIKETYLFSDIARKVRDYKERSPEAELIRMGIGDVTLPLPAPCVDALVKAGKEMGVKETFRGYPPEYGYDFLRGAIAFHYRKLGADIADSEVFVSDGAKSDLGNLPDILGDNPIIIPDPVYPVYVDSNLMAGRRISYVKGDKDNGFLPEPPKAETAEASVIYICSPNNPTGAVYTREGLTRWVDFALKTGSLIIFDSAYEAFISDDLPHTIYEIEGSKECAIEVSSFSKFAGFTGTRCGWAIVPDQLTAGGVKLSKLWSRRQATKFNGVSYPVQRAAEASLTDEGLKALKANIDYYKNNARLMSDLLRSKGLFFTGGTNSPYIWLKCPDDMGGWEFFDLMLTRFGIVGTPGEGFGEAGKGYFRLTAFGSAEDTKEAIRRLRDL